ncbi:MAG: PEP-CTERM sorting domain-containing protein [Kiritimatiellae bacterium]|nr:PEP-CTERM sorting domain-containing protein [Kiritimatiellia bacterium]
MAFAFRLPRCWLIASLCMALSAPARAAVIYNSEGFEDPPYSLGDLVGQQGWLGSGPEGDEPIVQSSVALDGAQAAAALRLGADLGTSIMAYRSFSPSAALVGVRTWIRVEDMGPSVNDFDAFYVYDDSFSGSRATILYFRGNGNVTVFDGETERTVTTWVDDTWYYLDFTFDVPNQMFDLTIGGALVADDFAFLNASATAIGGVAYQEYGGLSGGGMYWDDLDADDNIPEPEPGLLLGAATLGLFLLRKRRS